MEKSNYQRLLKGVIVASPVSLRDLAESFIFTYEATPALSYRTRIIYITRKGEMHEVTEELPPAPAVYRDDVVLLLDYIKDQIWRKTRPLLDRLQRRSSHKGDVVGFLTETEFLSSERVRWLKEFFTDYRSVHNSDAVLHNVIKAYHRTKKHPFSAFFNVRNNTIVYFARKHDNSTPSVEFISVRSESKWFIIPAYKPGSPSDKRESEVAQQSASQEIVSTAADDWPKDEFGKDL